MSEAENNFVWTLIMRVFVVVGAIALFLGSCSPVNEWLGLSDDNVAEELIEGLIESETGLLIDLTPQSPE